MTATITAQRWLNDIATAFVWATLIIQFFGITIALCWLKNIYSQALGIDTKYFSFVSFLKHISRYFFYFWSEIFCLSLYFWEYIFKYEVYFIVLISIKLESLKCDLCKRGKGFIIWIALNWAVFNFCTKLGWTHIRWNWISSCCEILFWLIASLKIAKP